MRSIHLLEMDISRLQQPIATLERHAEAVRIRKLIYWVCEQEWPHSSERLEGLSRLLPRLVVMAEGLSGEVSAGRSGNLASTPTVLRELLMKGVSMLSKRQQYTEIALVICNALTPLYAGEAERKITAVQQPLDIFELRLAVIKYTVPVHAKILIQSALDQMFTGQRRDWIALRQVSLDDLLLNLCQTFSTFHELEDRLQQTVERLQVLDQPTQAMGAVLQAVKPLYASQAVPASAASGEKAECHEQAATDPLFAEDITMLVAANGNISKSLPGKA